MVKAEGRRMTGGPGCDGITRCRRGGRGLGKYRVHGGRLWAPHLLATPAIVIGRRKKGTPRVIIISHFQVERETRQVQFYQGRKRIETLSSRDACSALDSCEMGYCIKHADQVVARAVQGATLCVGDRRCHPRVGCVYPRLSKFRDVEVRLSKNFGVLHQGPERDFTASDTLRLFDR